MSFQCPEKKVTTFFLKISIYTYTFYFLAFRLPMQKCYDVVSCFRSTGLPVSVTVMSDIEHTVEQKSSKENRKIHYCNESICEESVNENGNYRV